MFPAPPRQERLVATNYLLLNSSPVPKYYLSSLWRSSLGTVHQGIGGMACSELGRRRQAGVGLNALSANALFNSAECCLSASFLTRPGCSSQTDLVVCRHHTFLAFSLSFPCSFSGEFIQEFYIEYLFSAWYSNKHWRPSRTR